ncbi:MAG: hypothetical protein RLZZ574_3243, partial [Cyanobacteriota bacterium]
HVTSLLDEFFYEVDLYEFYEISIYLTNLVLQ